MLKKRIIPKLQMKKSLISNQIHMVLVNTNNFDKYSEIGDPISQAKIYQAQGADELIFLDIESDDHEFHILLDIINKASSEIFMPFTVGGGVDNLKKIRELTKNGADRVSINSEGVRNPEFIQKASEKFGKSTIVVSIDYKLDKNDNTSQVFIDNGNSKTSLNAIDWAIEAERLGAGELLLTNIENDGKKNGLDYLISNEIASKVSIPVILSGGCGRASHFIDGFKKGKADAIAAGTYFSYRDQNPMQTRAHIFNAGIPIRMQI